jgi:hypothetical protein
MVLYFHSSTRVYREVVNCLSTRTDHIHDCIRNIMTLLRARACLYYTRLSTSTDIVWQLDRVDSRVRPTSETRP